MNLIEIKEAVEKSISLASVCRYLGWQEKGSNFNRIKKYIKEYNLDISHFKRRYWDTSVYGKVTPLEELLVENSTYQSTKLKKRLLKENVKEYRCEHCGLTDWLGENINLELHHLNGNHYDNRLENLKLLCPNCHTLYHSKLRDTTRYNKEKIGISELEKEQSKQTNASIIIKKEKPKNYCLVCGKELEKRQTKYCSYECAKKSISKKPTYDELLLTLQSNDYNLTKTGKIYGVSSNAIKKWCKSYNITNGTDTFIHKKKIEQYDLNMNLIGVFDSIADAISKTQITTIKKVLQNRAESAGGFIWRYAD